MSNLSAATLAKLIDGNDLAIVNVWFRNLILKSGTYVSAVPSTVNEMPQLTLNQAYIYAITVATTSIPKNDSSVLNLPTGLTSDVVYVLDMCTVDNSVTTNTYILLDGDTLYSGTISGNTNSGWSKITADVDTSQFLTDPGDIVTPVTQAQYNALSAAAKNNGQAYFISDGNDSEFISIVSILSTMTHKGEKTLSTLPSTPSQGDFYYCTDVLEGRYWNGSAWKRVR